MNRPFVVEWRDQHRRFKPKERCATLVEAIARVCMCDPDGLFDPDARIRVDDRIVMNYLIWSKERQK